MSGGHKGGGSFHTEDPVHQIDIFFHEAEELVLAGGMEISHCRLDEVTEAVKLMLVTDGEALIGVVEVIETVIIAVIQLAAAHIVDKGIGFCLQPFVSAGFQRKGKGFDPFCHVGIPKDVGLPTLTLLHVPVTFQGSKAMGLFKTVVNGVRRYLAGNALLFTPERTGQFRFEKGDLFHVNTSSSVF